MLFYSKKPQNSQLFFFSTVFFRLLRVQKQMDSSAGAGQVPVFKFHFRLKKKKVLKL